MTTTAARTNFRSRLTWVAKPPQGYSKLPIGTEFIVVDGLLQIVDGSYGVREGNNTLLDNGYRYRVYVRVESFAERNRRIAADNAQRLEANRAEMAAPREVRATSSFDDWN